MGLPDAAGSSCFAIEIEDEHSGFCLREHTLVNFPVQRVWVINKGRLKIF